MGKKIKHPIPEGVAVNILIRLPVKSLFRFTCVSKGWQSVVLFDRKFVKEHFKIGCEQRTLTPKLLTSDLITHQVECLDLEKSFLYNPALVRKLDSPFKEADVYPMGSCNGLILVSHDDYEDLSVWNPSTGFLHRLPQPRFSIEGLGEGYYCNHGIGYVSATDDYKVLICYYVSIDDGYEVVNEFLVFSLRANLWKRIDDPRPQYMNIFESTEGVLSHEALHWLDFWDNVQRQVILAFDLASEEFRRLPVPNFNEGHYWEHMGAFVGGCLCVAGWYRYENGVVVEEYIEFCVMREYGVGQSWTKLFKFRVFQDVRDDILLWGLKPIVYTERGTVVIVIGCDNGLIRAEMPIESMVGYARHASEKEMKVVVKYEETLLSLIDYRSPTQGQATNSTRGEA